MIFKKTNKKALTMSLIVALILVLIVIVGLWYFYYFKVFDPIDAGSRKQICKSSVYTHFASKMFGKDVFNTPIKCKTELVTIEKDKNDQAKQVIAKAMYDCWDQFGEGELELFGKSGIIGEGKIYCTVCNHITFEDENLQINDLLEYLSISKIPRTGADYYGKEKIPSYMEYLANYKTIDAGEIIKAKEHNLIEENIDTSKNKNYAVIFVYAKGVDKIKKFLEYSAKGTGITLMGVGAFAVVKSKFLIFTPKGFALFAGGSAAIKTGSGITAIAHYLGPDEQWMSGIVFRPYHADIFKEGGIECNYDPAAIT